METQNTEGGQYPMSFSEFVTPVNKVFISYPNIWAADN